MSLPPHELESTWNGIRDELRRSVTDLAFHLWLEPLALAGRERHLLYVRAPRHIRTLVEERYLPLLRRAGERAVGEAVAVKVVGEDWLAGESRAPSTGACGRSGVEPIELNPKYTFEQFVIGDGNRLAHAAALAVAEQPGQAYNPLFLYGRPGLGKTHLLHAIGNYVQRFGAGMTIRYVTSDAFTSDFVRAVRGDGIDAFKATFRNVDVLLADDVQFLADRTKTQEEFFHTFNALYEAGCQLVVSSDRAPRDMGSFEQRLAERFAAGLVVELEPPALEVRLAILRKRVTLDGVDGLDDATLRAVAGQVDASVRELEGALIRVVAYASLRGEAPTPELARRLLTKIRWVAADEICSVEDVQQATATVFHLPTASLIAHDRRPQIAFARQVAMYLARELTGATLPAIGAGFGGRNHSTVLHAHRRIGVEIERDAGTAKLVEQVRAKLTAQRHDRVE